MIYAKLGRTLRAQYTDYIQATKPVTPVRQRTVKILGQQETVLF